MGKTTKKYTQSSLTIFMLPPQLPASTDFPRPSISKKALRFAQREKLRKKSVSERQNHSIRHVVVSQVRSFPWWFASFLAHLLILFFSTHLFIEISKTPELYVFEVFWEPTVVAVTVEEKLVVTPDSSVTVPAIEPEEPLKEVPKETPVRSMEVDPQSPQKTLAVPEKKLEPEPHHVPSVFQNRRSGKKLALQEYGGGANTESAVEKGLDWLARHQSSNGSWNPSSYTQHCLGKKCDLQTSHANHSTGLSGLALLCFLGAGETPSEGKYQKNVSKVIQFLLKQQKTDGSFGPGTPDTYNQAIATLALIEAYSMIGNENCKNAGQKAVLYLSKIQQSGGGWDYYDLPSKRNDTSITGWVVMAFHSAQYAGLDVPASSLKKAKNFIHCMYNQNGSFYYNNLEPQIGAGMTGVGSLCLLYLGEKPTSLLMQQNVRTLQKYPPDWLKLANTQQFPPEHQDIYNYTLYAWYYGTLFLFHLGGEPWTLWNEKLKIALLKNQQTKECKQGSWDPVEAFFASSFGGRLYATTLNLLTLEVYYRYLPLYRSLDPSLKPNSRFPKKEKK
ncbi:MAG: prenyltransferase/squalene oxidase repeat-containing protein [Planctomycetota bacterium]